MAITSVHTDLDLKQSGSLYKVNPSDILVDKYPNLCVIPMIHNVDVHRNEFLPFVVINLASKDVSLLKGETIGYMNIQPLEISEIMTETSIKPTWIVCEIDEKTNPDKQEEAIKEKVEKRFITSPADIDIHRKLNYKMLMFLRSINKHLETYVQNLLIYFPLIQVTLEKHHYWKLKLIQVIVHQSPQKPYTLPLKHTEWVQRELEILEKAGAIVRSVSPWASPIIVVPKRIALGEPPKQRLCV